MCHPMYHNLYLERVTAKLAHFWSRDFGIELCAKR